KSAGGWHSSAWPYLRPRRRSNATWRLIPPTPGFWRTTSGFACRRTATRPLAAPAAARCSTSSRKSWPRRALSAGGRERCPGGGVPVERVPWLVQRVLRELHKVWEYNGRQSPMRVAIDGQLSNWAIEGFDGDAARLDDPVSLLYIDTSTPLYRIEGREQLDPE